jgi:hypothetical protein
MLEHFIELNNRVIDRFSAEERRNIDIHTCPFGRPCCELRFCPTTYACDGHNGLSPSLRPPRRMSLQPELPKVS